MSASETPGDEGELIGKAGRVFPESVPVPQGEAGVRLAKSLPFRYLFRPTH